MSSGDGDGGGPRRAAPRPMAADGGVPSPYATAAGGVPPPFAPPRPRRAPRSPALPRTAAGGAPSAGWAPFRDDGREDERQPLVWRVVEERPSRGRHSPPPQTASPGEGAAAVAVPSGVPPSAHRDDGREELLVSRGRRATEPEVQLRGPPPERRRGGREPGGGLPAERAFAPPPSTQTAWAATTSGMAAADFVPAHPHGGVRRAGGWADDERSGPGRAGGWADEPPRHPAAARGRGGADVWGSPVDPPRLHPDGGRVPVGAPADAAAVVWAADAQGRRAADPGRGAGAGVRAGLWARRHAGAEAWAEGGEEEEDPRARPWRALPPSVAHDDGEAGAGGGLPGTFMKGAPGEVGCAVQGGEGGGGGEMEGRRW